MLTKTETLDLINKISLKIVNYLKNYDYKILSIAKAEAGYNEIDYSDTELVHGESYYKKKHYNYNFIDYANGKCIAMRSHDVTGDRDINLSLERLKIMIQIQQSLIDAMKTLANPEVTTNTLKTIVTDISKQVDDALYQNELLSAQYNKHHRSFTQNRKLGYGFFQSLFSRTLYQSRACNALEDIQELIKQSETQDKTLVVSI